MLDYLAVEFVPYGKLCRLLAGKQAGDQPHWLLGGLIVIHSCSCTETFSVHTDEEQVVWQTANVSCGTAKCRRTNTSPSAALFD